MNPTKKIQKILDNIQLDRSEFLREYYINTVHNEFLTFDGKIEIPRISVKELNYRESIPIVQDLVKYIPDFLNDHFVLKEKQPASEQYYLHFIKRISGKLINLIHMFKIDFKFGGDPVNIIKKGDPDNYPSYHTNRLYYKSRLIPESKASEKKNPDSFEQLKLMDKTQVEADGLFFTAAIFDDMNEKKINMDFCEKIGFENLNKSYELYPFIAFDYFTACLNIIKPDKNEIETATKLYEPLFLFLYSKYKNVEKIAEFDKISNEFKDELKIDNNIIQLNSKFKNNLREYFNRFILTRNDELSLKGWWKFEKNN